MDFNVGQKLTRLRKGATKVEHLEVVDVRYTPLGIQIWIRDFETKKSNRWVSEAYLRNSCFLNDTGIDFLNFRR